MRLAQAGYRILIGSRSEEKARATAEEILSLLKGEAKIQGTSNLLAARSADIAVLTVPYDVHRTILEELRDALQGKILVDVTVPLSPPNVNRAKMPPAGSAAQEAYEILGENVEVVSAFQNISYKHLWGGKPTDCEVLVTGTSSQARDITLQLVDAAGFTGWDAGPIDNSMVAEGLTSLLIHINKQYGSTNAGLKITGVRKNVKD
jgi:8-hydroxy-5-deazaflavin:NADPH oxidoreductase